SSCTLPQGARSTRPKERAPEPYEGRALFHGEREIIAHSHREVGQFNPETLRDLVTQPARTPEMAAQLRRRGIGGRDRHQTPPPPGPPPQQSLPPRVDR